MGRWLKDENRAQLKNDGSASLKVRSVTAKRHALTFRQGSSDYNCEITVTTKAIELHRRYYLIEYAL